MADYQSIFKGAEIDDGITKARAHETSKANIDGSYEDMSVGNAEQLISSVHVEDKVPYNFRTSGGNADIGNRETDKIVGGTLAWNQLVDSEGTDVTIASGHKYFANIGGTKTIGSSDGNAITGLTGGTDMIVDLTLMFGSTIANHVYTLEQANAGAGVAWFKALFPKDVYPYNAGELMSVKTSGHKTIGFNAYKHTAGTAKLIGGKQYQINGTYSSVTYTDVSGNSETLTIDEDGKFTPTNNGTLTVVGGNATNTCVHLVWDGERDGEFEEYAERVYPLGSDLELRGVPRLDANNNLYYYGDTYDSDGTVTRNFAVINLGTLNWTADGNFWYTTGLPKWLTNTNAISNKLSYGGTSASTKEHEWYLTGSRYFEVYVPSASSSADVQTALSGTYLVYKKDTPTTETADAYQNPQIVDDWGTEEYVDSRAIAIPVGHVTQYMANLKAKIEMSPDSPSNGDGDYVVRQTSGINEYVKLVFPTELPTAPTTDGTYILKATVTDGVATLSWESQS